MCLGYRGLREKVLERGIFDFGPRPGRDVLGPGIKPGILDELAKIVTMDHAVLMASQTFKPKPQTLHPKAPNARPARSSTRCPDHPVSSMSGFPHGRAHGSRSGPQVDRNKSAATGQSSKARSERGIDCTICSKR